MVTEAGRADDAIRAINHLTIRGDGGIDFPSELDQVIRSLAAMVEKLPQALDQLADIGDGFTDHAGLYDDRGFNPHGTIRAATTELATAISAVGVLAAPLRRAANELSHLGLRDG
ncbi:hypothetical protein [Pseudofrankia asymbiotica]|uniref:Uncharacterized protein n=1 Tax=Pseudofrankia asymbiotica TaxID=1834516 RepID=A0A1V2I1X3_9ACTN|nr:hypothetical protein [Pseudofrankia asymbiotica]ONH23821.1 hypothetical protein BL253_31890 [Pseudofrankia asymbiotica]